jgi:hypothetical protein
MWINQRAVLNGCIFPSRTQPVWFGSFFSGEGIASDYAITLSYLTNEVNDLPKKGSLQLKHVFSEVIEMLKTLQLKPPISILKIDPQSTSPGASVTIYGTGFHVLDQSATVRFSEFPNNPMPAPIVAADGQSLMFKVPTSLNTISCQAGHIDVNGWCVPIPANHVDVDDCPSRGDGLDNFCGKPLTLGLSVDGSLQPTARLQSITPGYFQTLHIPLRRGREFTERDNFRCSPISDHQRKLCPAFLAELSARLEPDWPAFAGRSRSHRSNGNCRYRRECS